MPDLIKRIFGMAKAGIAHVFEKMAEEPVIHDYDEGNNHHSQRQNPAENTVKNSMQGWPVQVVEDLRAFGLEPPSSMDEVKKARNREIRKYHSDRFVNDPDRFETSKQIMQILNAAYERLEKWFEVRSF